MNYDGPTVLTDKKKARMVCGGTTNVYCWASGASEGLRGGGVLRPRLHGSVVAGLAR